MEVRRRLRHPRLLAHDQRSLPRLFGRAEKADVGRLASVSFKIVDGDSPGGLFGVLSKGPTFEHNLSGLFSTAPRGRHWGKMAARRPALLLAEAEVDARPSLKALLAANGVSEHKKSVNELPRLLPAPPVLPPVALDSLELDEALRDVPVSYILASLRQLGELHSCLCVTLELH